MFMKKTLIAATLMAFAGAAAAATSPATATFTVSLQVNKTCVVSTTSASNITLGATDANGTSASSSGTFSVNCSNTTPFYVGLAPSNGSTVGTGTLKGAISGNTATVAYALYQDAGLTTAWGNTASSTAVGNGVGGTGQGMSAAKAISEKVYAKATGSTDVQPDTYSDTVTINVNF